MFFLSGIMVLIFLSTFCFPLIAVLFSLFSPRKPYRPSPEIGVKKITFAIPCANRDLAGLPKTLRTIRTAVRRISSQDVSVSVLVFLDGVADADVPAYDNTLPVRVLNSPRAVGKWTGLSRLVDAASKDGDILILCDASTFVPGNFLVELITAYKDETVVAVAPNYRPRRSSSISANYWKLEESLKALEGVAGGSISVHGALASYRSEPLKKAFTYLLCFKLAWVHDDLVIPLIVRVFNPNQRLVYRTDLIARDFDTGPARTSKTSLRMAWGNWQWISRLIIEIWRQNFLLFVISLRRIVRSFLPLLVVLLALLALPFSSIWESILQVGFVVLLISISPSVRATLWCFGEIVSGKRQSDVWG